MRISTAVFYERSAKGMGELQQRLFSTQQKLGAGTKFLTPSDDPVAAARSLAVGQSMAESAQHAQSRARAAQSLSLEEKALLQAVDVLQETKSLIVQAGNGTLSDADRSALATALESQLEELVGVGNSDDGNGQYLFAGFQGDRRPFGRDAAGTIVYGGDVGQRLAQVDVARQISTADDGQTVFRSVQGSAKFVTEAAAANSGTGVFSEASVTDGADYSVLFQPGGTYTVTRGADSWSGVYTSGATISAGGLSMRVVGEPAVGDAFTVRKAQNTNTDAFAAIKDLVAVLRNPAGATPDVSRARLANALSHANVRITNAHDNVLTIRSAVGSRLAEIDALDASGSAKKLADRTYLSELQDLDYAEALTEFAQRQTNLQATQQTFARLQGLSLFQYL